MIHDSGGPTPDQQDGHWALRPRILLAGALVPLLIIGLALWSAHRNRDLGPPLMISPALGAVPTPSLTPAATAPTTAPSASPPSSRPATTKVSTSKAARPSPSRSRSASPTPGGSFTARYVSSAERRGTFQAGIVLENSGRTARTWQVRVTYAAADRVRVERTFGARASTSGSTVVFSGGPVEPGRSTMVGFQATTTGDGEIRPTSCQVDGRACTISFR